MGISEMVGEFAGRDCRKIRGVIWVINLGYS